MPVFPSLRTTDIGGYRAALSEMDASKLPERIAEAERAVVLRARELFQAAGDKGEMPSLVDSLSNIPTAGIQVDECAI